MKRKCIEFPIDDFLKEFPQFQEKTVKIYIDLENAREIVDFLNDRQHRKKLRMILFEIFNLRYNESLYGKENVSAKAKDMTAMKFSQKETMRIYCKEFSQVGELNHKYVVMICLYHKKVWKSTQLKKMIEHLGGYDYEFSS